MITRVNNLTPFAIHASLPRTRRFVTSCAGEFYSKTPRGISNEIPKLTFDRTFSVPPCVPNVSLSRAYDTRGDALALSWNTKSRSTKIVADWRVA